MRSFEAGILTLLSTIAVISVFSAEAASAAGPSAEAGAKISAQCAACHGSDGMSVDTSIPNLAGQHYAYLVAQTSAFKQRTRTSAEPVQITKDRRSGNIKAII